jgi:hypothetical protein
MATKENNNLTTASAVAKSADSGNCPDGTVFDPRTGTCVAADGSMPAADAQIATEDTTESAN